MNSTRIIKVVKSSMLSVLLFTGLSAYSQINTYEVADKGFLRNPREASKGIVATNNRFSEIYLVENNQVKTLVSGLGCGAYTKLSKDGKLLGFKSITSDYKQAPAILNIETGEVLLLEDYSEVQCGQVSFSNDGTMAYTLGNNLVIRRGEKRNYTDLGEYINIVNISPDGKTVAYSSPLGHSYLVDVATGIKEEVIVDGSADAVEPIWSPDNSKLAYQNIDGTVTVVDRFTRANYQIGKASSVVWTDDSKSIYFSYPEGRHEFDVSGASVIKSSFNGLSREIIAASADYPSDLAKTSDGALLVSYASGDKKGLTKLAVNALYKSETALLKIGKDMRFGKCFGPDYNTVRKVVPTVASVSKKGPQREGTIKYLDIPYINQVWDTPSSYDGTFKYGYVCCAPSSSCMLLGYYKMLEPHAVTSRQSNVGQVYYSWYVGRDYIAPLTGYNFNLRASGNGSTDVGGGYGYMWSTGSPNSRMAGFYKNNGMLDSSINSSWTTFCNESKADRPYTICLKNGTGGHVVLGFRSNTQANPKTGEMSDMKYSFVCHDPYGDYNGANYPNWDGRYSTYDWPGYNNGHANIQVFYWGCVAIPPKTGDWNPSMTVSTSSLHFVCKPNEKKSLTFDVEGKDLIYDIMVSSSAPRRFTPSPSNLSLTGGKVTVVFYATSQLGTYGAGGTVSDNDYNITVKSGTLEHIIKLTAEVTNAEGGVEGVNADGAGLFCDGRTVSLSGADAAQITVCSTSGVIVADVRNSNEVNVSPLSSGAYIVKAVDVNGNILTTKFVK